MSEPKAISYAKIKLSVLMVGVASESEIDKRYRDTLTREYFIFGMFRIATNSIYKTKKCIIYLSLKKLAVRHYLKDE